MTKLTKLFIISFLIPFATFGQTYLHDGYLVSHSGDTIQGRVDLVNALKMTRKISFQQSGKTRVVHIFPEDWKWVVIGTSHKIKSIETSPGVFLFFEVMVEGEVSLYYNGISMYIQIKDKLHVIKKLDTAYRLLKGSGYIIDKSGVKSIGELTELIKAINYDELSLEWFEKDRQLKTKWVPGVYFGYGMMGMQDLEWSNDNIDYLYQYDPSSIQFAGISISPFAPRKRFNAQMTLSLGLMNISTEAESYSPNRNPNYYRFLDLTQLVTSFQMAVFTRNQRFFFEGGASVSNTLVNNSILLKESVLNNGYIFIEPKADDISIVYMGLNANAGFQYPVRNYFLSIKLIGQGYLGTESNLLYYSGISISLKFDTINSSF